MTCTPGFLDLQRGLFTPARSRPFPSKGDITTRPFPIFHEPQTCRILWCLFIKLWADISSIDICSKPCPVSQTHAHFLHRLKLLICLFYLLSISSLKTLSKSLLSYFTYINFLIISEKLIFCFSRACGVGRTWILLIHDMKSWTLLDIHGMKIWQSLWIAAWRCW